MSYSRVFRITGVLALALNFWAVAARADDGQGHKLRYRYVAHQAASDAAAAKSQLFFSTYIKWMISRWVRSGMTRSDKSIEKDAQQLKISSFFNDYAN